MDRIQRSKDFKEIPRNNDYTDTVINSNGSILNIDPEYHSTVITQVFKYAEKQCLLNLNKKRHFNSFHFVYILKFHKVCNSSETSASKGKTALLFDLIDVFSDDDLKTSLLTLDRGFCELANLRRVFIYNKFFLNKYLSVDSLADRSKIIMINHVGANESLAPNGEKIRYYTWKTTVPNDTTSLVGLINTWIARTAKFESEQSAHYPFEFVEKPEHISLGKQILDGVAYTENVNHVRMSLDEVDENDEISDEVLPAPTKKNNNK